LIAGIDMFITAKDGRKKRYVKIHTYQKSQAEEEARESPYLPEEPGREYANPSVCSWRVLAEAGHILSGY
jgi:hypothetical protein